MDHHSTCQIPLAHPCLKGHFPGHPVVPAVVILENVMTAVQAGIGDCIITGFSTVKFITTLKPGMDFNIGYSRISSNRIRFECTSVNNLVAQGDLEYTLPGPGR